jgi:hypothetical protein
MLKTSAEIVGHEPLPHEDVEELLSVGIVEDLADDVEAPLVAAVEDEIAARPGRERLDVVGDELDWGGEFLRVERQLALRLSRIGCSSPLRRR